MIKKINKYYISICLLRIIAILLITNTHMNNVYPLDSFAIGGFIGDVLFFVLSGFGLYSSKKIKFSNWYVNRIEKTFPIVWVCNIMYTFLGVYCFSFSTFFPQYIYPTNFHFVGSIIVLYIFYYFFILNKPIKNIKVTSVVTLLLFFIIYIFFYDKTYYHIDAVEEWMAKFIFFEGMIFGAYIRININRIIDLKNKILKMGLIVALPISCLFYYLIKVGLSRGNFPLTLQFVSQISVFLLVVNITLLLIIYNEYLEITLKKYKSILVNTSMVSLEIYVVQKPIIHFYEKLLFPVNFVLIIITIFVFAAGLQMIVSYIFSIIRKGELSNI